MGNNITDRLEYKVIKPHTPKQNGRVERSHRKDHISG